MGLFDNKWLRWVSVAGIMGGIFIVSSIPAASIPSFEGWLDLLVKKSGHVLAYGLLSFSLFFAMGNPTSETCWRAWGLAVLFAVTDEYHQLFVEGRGSWVVDIAIDAAGAALGVLAARLIHNRRTRGPGRFPPPWRSLGRPQGG